MKSRRDNIDISTSSQYNIHKDLDELIMFYDDYDLDYTLNNDMGIMDLDEMCEHYTSYNMQDTYDLDEDYGRDTYDYNELAYRHYA